MGELVSQYGTETGREAFVYKTRKGYHVDLYRATIFIIVLRTHSPS